MISYDCESLELIKLPLKGIIMRKINDKALTKIVDDGNH